VTDETRSLFERHFQSAALAVLVALVLWFGTTTLETERQVTILTVQMKAIQDNYTARMLDRYTGTQAKSYERYVQLQIQSMLKRLEINAVMHSEFESRLDVLEKPNSDQ
jgi:hypothetical protein